MVEREPTPGDGSCLAHALVDQMTRDPLLSLNRLDHYQLRKYVVNSLPQPFEQFFRHQHVF